MGAGFVWVRLCMTHMGPSHPLPGHRNTPGDTRAFPGESRAGTEAANHAHSDRFASPEPLVLQLEAVIPASGINRATKIIWAPVNSPL